MTDKIPESPVKVFLLIENRLLREALGRLCRKRSDLKVIRETGSRELTPDELSESDCHVVTMDFFNPHWFPGVSAAKDARCSKIKLLLIGMEGEGAQFVQAVKAGASGYLLKDASATDVIAAIRAISKGEAVCPPKLCSALFNWVANFSRQVPIAPLARTELTMRQRQMVELVARGLTNKEIAAHLNLSEFTVRNHIHRILKLVDVGTRHEAVDILQDRDQLRVNAGL